VEQRQALLSLAQRPKADVGHLAGGQHSMLMEQSADDAVTFGEMAGQLVEPIVNTV
jgi:hypothetical protein